MLRLKIAPLTAMLALATAAAFAQGQQSDASDKQLPTVISKLDATYSKEARAQHVSGSVVVQAQVSPEGRVTNQRVVKGLGHGLDASTMDAVSEWTFKPGLTNGKPVTMQVLVSMNFSDEKVTSEILPNDK